MSGVESDGGEAVGSTEMGCFLRSPSMVSNWDLRSCDVWDLSLEKAQFSGPASAQYSKNVEKT